MEEKISSIWPQKVKLIEINLFFNAHYFITISSSDFKYNSNHYDLLDGKKLISILLVNIFYVNRLICNKNYLESVQGLVLN